jgi:hypothetical protein
MSPLRMRLTLMAIMAIFLATAGNALFLQDRTRLRQANNLPSTAVSISQIQPGNTSAETSQARRIAPPAFKPAGGGRDARLQTALLRELSVRGYIVESQSPGNGLRLAVLAYEFDKGLALTGEPTETLLKRILFDLSQAPRGVFADRAEANSKLVMEAQKALLELGFLRGTISGRMDAWTADAVKAFERHRGIPQTGRLSEVTLLELVSYSGQPIPASSG